MWNTSSKNHEGPLRVGITGGIGSGKSVACRIFRILGVPVFEADGAARAMYGRPDIRRFITERFGEGFYGSDGTPDRQRLASLFFGQPSLLREVGERIHPLVWEAFEQWYGKQEGCYVLYEAAILFETGRYRDLDAIILVTAPEEVRISRVMDRDRLSREEVLARMGSQWTDGEKAPLAGFVVINDDHTLVTHQLLDIDRKIRNYGKFR